MNFWKTVIVPALERILQDFLGILPNLIAAIIILLIGWLVAKLLENVVRRLLKRIGFNKLSERTGIAAFLKNAGFKQEVSWVVGKLIFWLLIMVFMLSAAETLQLTALALSIQKVVGFIPNLIAVVLILVFGALLARLAGRLVKGAAVNAEIDFADFLSKLVTNVILIAIAVIAISQLEIQSNVLDIIFAALIGAVGLAIALTLGLGSRKVSYNIICGVYARKTYRVGQIVKIGDSEGELLQIGTINATIRTGQDLMVFPNNALIETKTVISQKTEA